MASRSGVRSPTASAPISAAAVRRSAQTDAGARAGAAVSASTGIRCARRSPRWCMRACCAASKAAARSSSSAGVSPIRSARARASRPGSTARHTSCAALLVGHAYDEASEAVAAGLAIKRGARVLRLETMSEADGQPLSRSTSHFDAARFNGMEQIFEETRSITASFRKFGVDDYLRRSTSSRRVMPMPPTSMTSGCRQARSCS